MVDTVNNVLQLGNEIFLYMCIGIALLFTNYTTDPNHRHLISIVYLVFLGFNVTINVILILYSIIVMAIKEFRERKEKKNRNKTVP